MASVAINKFELQFIDPTISFSYGSATCVSVHIDLFGCSSERSNCQTTWGTIGNDGGIRVGHNDEHGGYTVRLAPGAVVSHQFVPWQASAKFPIDAVVAVQRGKHPSHVAVLWQRRARRVVLDHHPVGSVFIPQAAPTLELASTLKIS